MIGLAASDGLLAAAAALAAAGSALLAAGRRRPRPVSVPETRLGSASRIATATAGSIRLPGPLDARLERTRERLALAGEGKSLWRFEAERGVCALAMPLIPVLPLAAVEGHLPSLWLALPLALVGLAVPDLALRRALARRRERILLDLPDALSMLALALAAGRSLHQGLALAARETGGPLGSDIQAALSLARRDGSLDERAALARVARASGEPNFARMAELLAAKESPYSDFLRTQAAQARAEQSRALEQAADRAYLAMHAPLAPLLATLVLLVSYGFLHVLDQSI